MISITLCYISNWLLKPPSEIYKKIEFSFDEIGKSLKNDINVNCFQNTYEKNCIFLENNTLYSLGLELRLMRNQAFQNDKYKNFEVQINLNGNYKNEKFKKVVFIERYDYIIELSFDILYFPFRMFGFMNDHIIKLDFIDEFDNNKYILEKIEIFINDQYLNVKQANLKLIPRIGYIRSFISILRYVLIPLIFFLTFVGFLSLYFGIKFVTIFFNWDIDGSNQTS